MNPEQSVKQTYSISNQSIVKLLIIDFILLVLIVPAVWISFVIGERSERKESVVEEIFGNWGSTQILTGSLISVPYVVKEQILNSGSKVEIPSTRYLNLAPDSLRITGKIETVAHNRFNFKVLGYQADLAAVPTTNLTDGPAYRELPLSWNEALVSFDLDDQRGLKQIRGTLNGQDLAFKPSAGVLSVLSLSSAVVFISDRRAGKEAKTTDLRLVAAMTSDSSHSDIGINIQMKMTGTQELKFVSLAVNEGVALESDWLAPSFIGNLLPESRSVDGSGFTAS